MIKKATCRWCSKEFEFDTLKRHGAVAYCSKLHYKLSKSKRKREQYHASKAQETSCVDGDQDACLTHE